MPPTTNYKKEQNMERIIDYKSYDGRTYSVKVREDEKNWYVDFQTGLGEGIYPKEDFTLEKAIEDQDHIYDENYI